jgi:hypothetical protein
MTGPLSQMARPSWLGRETRPRASRRKRLRRDAVRRFLSVAALCVCACRLTRCVTGSAWVARHRSLSLHLVSRSIAGGAVMRFFGAHISTGRTIPVGGSGPTRSPATSRLSRPRPSRGRNRTSSTPPTLSKVPSVDQRMRLECGVRFRQLRTRRRTRPGQLRAISGHPYAGSIASMARSQAGLPANDS